MRDLGEMGEAALRQWAAQVGIAVNKAVNDRGGWDFFLELPLVDAGGAVTLSADRALRATKVLVQVKATDGRGGSVSVKLSNWLSLAQVALPCFFLVVEFDRQPVPQRAYLVHVGESHVRAVLHRLRKLSANRRRPAGELEIHKLTRRVTYDRRHILPALTGEALWGGLRAVVADDPVGYARSKAEFYEAAGYEDGRHFYRLELARPEEYGSDEEYLVEFALGLIPSIRASNAELHDVRFGIPGPEPLSREEDVDIRSGGTEPVAHVAVRFSGGGRPLVLGAALYVPLGILVAVDDPAYRVRVAAPHFDLLVSLSRNDLRFRTALLRPGDEHPIEDHARFADVVEYLHAASEAGRHVRVEVTHRGNVLAKSGEFDPALPLGKDPDRLLRFARATRAARVLRDAAGLGPDLRADVGELLAQRGRLLVLSWMFERPDSSEPMPMRVRFMTTDGRDWTDVRVRVPQVIDVVLGGQLWAFVFDVGGVARPNPEPDGVHTHEVVADGYEFLFVRSFDSAMEFSREEVLVEAAGAIEGRGEGPVILTRQITG